MPRDVGVHGKAYAENGVSPFNLAVSAASDFVVDGRDYTSQAVVARLDWRF